MPRLPAALATACVLAELPTLKVYTQVLLSAATVTGEGTLMVVPRSAAAIAPPPVLATLPVPQPVPEMAKPTVVPGAAGEVSEGSVALSVGVSPPVMPPGETAKVFELITGSGAIPSVPVAWTATGDAAELATV